MWFGLLNQGVIRTSFPDFNQVCEIPELRNKSVSKALKDREGGFWISTLEKGVYYIPNFEIKSLSFKTTARVRAIGNIANRVLIGDYSGHLMAENSENGHVQWKRNFNSPITSAFVSRDSLIWVSCVDGTTILDKNGSVIKTLTEASFTDFTQEDAQSIWAFNSYGLHLFTNKGNLVLRKKLDSWNRNITKVDNTIYVSGRNGLQIYDTLFNFKMEVRDFKDFKISKILAFGNYLLITTTGNGFFLWDKSLQVIAYASYGNFISNYIYDAMIGNGLIWIATDNGIAVCTKESLYYQKPKFFVINRQNGLLASKVNKLKLYTNKVFAFCDEGYSVLPVHGTIFVNRLPLFYLKFVQSSNKKLDPTTPIVLSKSENDIQIGVGFLSYKNQNIYSRFRVKEENSWTYSTNRVFQFNSLDEGDYFFDLEYSLDNFTWTKAPTRISFTILPSWWQTWYFRTLVLLAVSAIGYVIYRTQVARYKEKNSYLNLMNDQQRKLLGVEIATAERERSRIAKDLHDGISSNLISIKLLANRIARKAAPKEADEIEEQIHKLISEVRNIIHGLTPPGLSHFGLSTTIANYVLVVEKNHSIKLTFDYQGETVIDDRISTIIFRIVQELTTNSIRHACCRLINLHINVFSDTISISYADDGVGFNPDLVSKGFGLLNVQSRVDSLGGALSFESGEFGTSYSIDIPHNANSKN